MGVMSGSLESGVYPASVTPFDDSGAIDAPSVLRLMSYFESSGCRGVVLAGTNGEGPSLSAYEKRDLLQIAHAGRGSLKIILGVSTPSVTEARWLCGQADKHGADAVLLMAPGYFRRAGDEGVLVWFEQVIATTTLPILVYNFPKMTGITMTPAMVGRLMQSDRVIGLKDSSGEVANLATYREVVPPGKALFMGDETLLADAIGAGWTGTISGAANLIPAWLSKAVTELQDGDSVAFKMVEPVIHAIRGHNQPEVNKAVLHALGVITSPAPRAPLQATVGDAVLRVLKERLGIDRGSLGL